MFSDEFMALYENSYIIWIHALLAQFLICGCNYFLHLWRSERGRTVMFVWTCTDMPWVSKRRPACSSPALLAAPFFDGNSHCQDSLIAMSNVAWIHVSAWMQASLQCKANRSVGCLLWTTWWLPLVVPGSLFETCFCKVIIVEASLSNNFVSFGKTDILETLTYKVEQWWTVFCESEEVLGLKSCLVVQMAMLCIEHMAFHRNIKSN